MGIVAARLWILGHCDLATSSGERTTDVIAKSPRSVLMTALWSVAVEKGVAIIRDVEFYLDCEWLGVDGVEMAVDASNPSSSTDIHGEGVLWLLQGEGVNYEPSLQFRRYGSGAPYPNPASHTQGVLVGRTELATTPLRPIETSCTVQKKIRKVKSLKLHQFSERRPNIDVTNLQRSGPNCHRRQSLLFAKVGTAMGDDGSHDADQFEVMTERWVGKDELEALNVDWVSWINVKGDSDEK
ncbi:hypothetical protein BD410DRAFT_829041 [Rickenella mellea]|uniref:Uncharacterized protein n=1 Tax=Rickenella mellea TaxID=50990 RepID=A0A4Y7Q405_9AGAM|nr:hypothetical protein BD410DRAFT_829041 [Rickenella mellea]